jgi:signal transduction histidine kinase
MHLTFRLKLLGIVGVAAVAFLVILVAGAAIAGRVERQLVAIQKQYVPKLELEPQLEGRFERMQRAFQDAVAAHDLESLAATQDLKTEFLERLLAARDAVDPGEAAELRAAIDDYFAAARDVSRRLIDGETGEKLLDAIAAMQSKQARAAGLIKQTAALDQDDITAAFSGVTQAEATAKSYRLWVSVACLGAVLLLSLALSRGLIRSVGELSAGFSRFGRGDFGQPIRVSTQDELGELARHANDMAANLERLRSERARFEDALTLSNRELEAFSYSVAHDLRAPLRAINGFSSALLEDCGDKVDAAGKGHLDRIRAATERMGQLIDALLALSRLTRVELRREEVNLSRMADAVVKQLRAMHPDRAVDFVNDDEIVAHGDAPLLRALLENLLGNAWKFTATQGSARVCFGAETAGDTRVYFVRDNGAGFDMKYADKLFAPFQRLHSEAEFSGTGVGLATVHRIVQRHGGRIWAEGAVGRGATFHFTLANSPEGALP